MAANKAEIEITASTARLPAGLRAAMKMAQGFATAVTGLFNRTGSKRDPDVGNIAKGAAIGGVVSSLAVRGMDLLVDQGKEVFSFEKQLTRLGIAGRIVGPQLRAIGDAARRTSSEIGVSAIDVIAAGKSYMDLAGAQAFTVDKMNLLARAAQASGAKTTDLAGMMYQLTETMKLTDAQVEDTMGGLINQAKDGAIEAKDMAAEFASILPLFARFKDSLGPSGAIQAGAMFQVIRKGFNSASEAGTGIQRIFAGLRTYASRFEAHGVKIWDVGPDGVKRAKSISDIMKQISMSDLVKDPQLMKKAFGRTEGWRSMELLLENVNELARLEASGSVKGVIATDLATYTESASGRIEVAVQKIKNAFAEALTPERIDQIVAGIERLTEVMGPLMTAVSTVADGFAMAFNAGRKLRNLWEGGSTDTAQASHYKYTDKDLDILRAGSDTGKYHSTGAQRAAAGAVEAKKTAYDKAIDQIIGAEKNDRPTPESIRKAVALARADTGPDKASTPEGNAARSYLAERGDAISPAAYKKAEAELAEAAFAKQVNATLGPLLEKMGKSISDAIDRARAPVVKVDGNPIAQAGGNASDRRRRP